MISARCTRHCPRYGTRSGCAEHQSLSAAVHSWARRRSNRRWQTSITAQYTMPVVMGVVSPLVTATMASSSSAMPSTTDPWLMSARPRPRPAKVTTSTSPNRDADGGRALEGRTRAVEVPLVQELESHRQEQQSPFGAVLAVFLQDVVRAAEPSGSACHLAAIDQAHRDVERASGGSRPWPKRRAVW